MGETIEHVRESLESRGFREITSAPRAPGIHVGARVHNRGEQFRRAYTDGTATVVAVMRRGTDDEPDSWEQKWGRPNVEVIVQRDADRVAAGAAQYAAWADYGTEVAGCSRDGVHASDRKPHDSATGADRG